ncbi:putative diphthamide synthesis protein-domain-containing protein [Dipodascopsis uninucleata]
MTDIEDRLDGDSKDVAVFVMADTSYSECCVDEIASRHVDADVVVHIGVSCLNPVISVPVIYTFGEEPIDIEMCINAFRDSIADTESHVILMSETPFQAYLEQIRNRLLEYHNIITTIPYLASSNLESSPLEVIIPSSLMSPLSETHTVSGILPHRAHPKLKEQLENYTLYYIGIPPPSLHLHLSSILSSSMIIFDPSASALYKDPVTPLARRYRAMLSARSASTVGLLVNTLSLRSYDTLIASLQSSIKAAGKKHYMIVVGKPNVAKLANFDVIDAWVIVGCSRGGIILDNNGQNFKPIVTPYEMMLALKREIIWGPGEWITDFERVLKLIDEEDKQKDEEQRSSDDASDDEDLPPEFDAVTGRYVASRPLFSRTSKVSHVDVEIESVESANRVTNDSLTSRSSSSLSTATKAGGLVTRGTQHYSTAAAHLQSRRFWKGLGSDFAAEEDGDSEHDADNANSKKLLGAKLESGRKGIARGYVNQ